MISKSTNKALLDEARFRTIENLRKTSRTADTGIVDASVSAEKKSVQVEPSRVALAIDAAINFSLSNISGDEREGLRLICRADELINGIALRIQRATLGDELVCPVLRTHAVPYGRRIPAENLPSQMTAFAQTLDEILKAKEYPPDSAAWVERELDHCIHPFTDGCGRIAKIIAMTVLVIHRQPVPAIPNRAVYYFAMEGKMNCDEREKNAEVIEFLRSAEADFVAAILSAPPEEQFRLCYRYWTSCRRPIAKVG